MFFLLLAKILDTGRGAKRSNILSGTKKGANTRRDVGIVGAASVAIGAAVRKSHKTGMAKRNAKKNGTVLIVGKRSGKTNAYIPTQTRREKKRAAKKKTTTAKKKKTGTTRRKKAA